MNQNFYYLHPVGPSIFHRLNFKFKKQAKFNWKESHLKTQKIIFIFYSNNIILFVKNYNNPIDIQIKIEIKIINQIMGN